ncbi:hypothetical protein [Paraburkholderia bannensis]|uniref:hypothetical protein n=1 Tax=Paraburkholderia bannensis TaxID=765414 RepID=UPI002ABE47DC|nr:hypothetical protein [Paraburkholderia bannensis]
MKRIFVFAVLTAIAWSKVWAAGPDEDLIKSCLQATSTHPAVNVEAIPVHEDTEKDDYKQGFDAKFMFTYAGSYAGYAVGKSDQALIFHGKLYRISRAVPAGNNHNLEPSEFDPRLAVWSIAKEGKRKYFCVGFNFDGLGRSGSFQHVYGGYVLDERTGKLYFAVRELQ